MQLPELCIRRPVFATVLSLLVLLIGAVSFTRLAVREYPKIDVPVVTVETKYLGASSEIVESQITKPIEDSIAGIEGVDVLTSISRAEQSQITVRFRLERNPDDAASDVRDRVARVRQRLPAGVDEPVVSKVEADANPIIWLAFASDRLSAMAVTDIANRIVKPRLQTLPGAADVRVFGERRFAMRIWLDRTRLAAFKLTVQEVEDALRRQNVEIPAGRIESASREFVVSSQTDLNRIEDFEAIVLRQGSSAGQAGYTVRLGDVARVEIAPASERSSVRYNGRSAVSLGVIKQATANPLILSKAVRENLQSVREALPEGVTLDVAYDSTVFIDRSIQSVWSTIVEAMVLVAVVILFFLRSWRASLIPLITIPVSLVGAFALMLLAGFTINTLTLLAMVLAIGLVVDDAIVVLENIHRHIEDGMKPIQAALLGSREIAFAVLAMTLTLVAVYAPVAFSTGRTGRLFIEFALTLAGAVLVSGFVALTLSPMMCSKLLTSHEGHGRVGQVIEGAINALTRAYGWLLSGALKARWLMVALVVLVAALAAWFFTLIRQELSPIEDRGVILSIFTAPEGSSIDYTERYAARIEQLARSERNPEIDRVFVVAGNPSVSQGLSFLRMKDWSERSRSSGEIAKSLQPQLLSIPGVLAFAVTPPSLGQSPRERPINMVITTTATYPELQKVLGQIMGEIAKNPGFQGPDVDLRLNKPELRLSLDRERAADAGVQVDTVGRTLESLLGGRQVTRFKKDGEQYDVIVQVDKSDRSTPTDIEEIYVRGRNDAMVPLDALLDVNEGLSPRELNHFGQRRAATITANLAPGYSMGEAVAFLQATSDKAMKPGFTVDWDGQTREFFQSRSSLALTFALALLFIYLVLSAQFESFIDPLIILFSVPLSMAGALAALLLTGGTLNVYSQMGLITLVGLITKHGILIVEFANQLQLKGLAIREAAHEAAVLRLRPVLMTTGAMVLGALPLALATGAGAESRQQMGWVIVGGMSFGTLLTLFVVPAIYTVLARRHAPEQSV